MTLLTADEPLLTYPRGVDARAILRESRMAPETSPWVGIQWYARLSYGIAGPTCTACPRCGSTGGRYFKGPKRTRRYAVKPPLLWIDHERQEAMTEPGWHYCRNDAWHGPSGTVSVNT